MGGGVSVSLGDCVEALKARAPDAPLFDSCVTDPPYHLTSIVKRFGAANAAPAKSKQTGAFARASTGFMGQTWDGGDVAFRPETWRAIYDALKPGAHLVAFSGTRTFHRMVCAIEDAGFEIRDAIFWCYGSGFPKSHNVAKGIDRSAGVDGATVPQGAPVRRIRPGADQDASGSWEKLEDREYQPGEYVPGTDDAAAWQGWGTALKPAVEPICLARKPLSEKSVAANVLRWGTGALNIDGCRVETAEELRAGTGIIPCRHDPEVPRGRAGEASAKSRYHESGSTNFAATPGPRGGDPLGRWPANLVHDGSEEVLSAFPDAPGAYAPVGPQYGEKASVNCYGDYGPREQTVTRDDQGSAARFFYTAKAGPLDRLGSPHPTIKPVDLMRWLCRLVTPPGGLILDPFAGSGTTGIAALAEGFECELIDIEEKHVADIRRKLAIVQGEGRHRLVEMNERKAEKQKPLGGLFAEGEAA